jgi:formate dehydrogenase maturation protein FdhE
VASFFGSVYMSAMVSAAHALTRTSYCICTLCKMRYHVVLKDCYYTTFYALAMLFG